MDNEKKRRSVSARCRLLTTALVASALCAVLGLAACQPAQKPAESTEPSQTTTEKTDKADASTFAVGDFQNQDAGILSDTPFNTSFVNAGNRGCGACHEDLWDQMHDLSPIQHVLSSPAGYGQSYGITDCMTCHSYNMPFGGPKLSDIIHSSHYANAQFTDVQNGNCWSCHATTVEGDIVLWDVYKYSSELGGYPNAASPAMQGWLDLRTQSNKSMVDVVSTENLALDVELSQPVSDEADMFVADNYNIPDISAESYEMKVTGVVNERTFTLDDLKAMPQVEITATQDCLTNAINGVMVGNFPIKGVLLSDIIDACGGVADGNATLTAKSADGWVRTQEVSFLLEQKAMIGLEYWGHELTPDQGYPTTLVVPGVGGAFWCKYLDELSFGTEKGYAGAWGVKDALPNAFQGVQCTGWFSPDKDGLEHKAGQPMDIDGYAFLNASNGHTLSQVAFSADYGTTWTTVDVPADFDQNQWVRFAGTWTPEKAGIYVLHVKAIDSAGSEQLMPASVIVKVTE